MSSGGSSSEDVGRELAEIAACSSGCTAEPAGRLVIHVDCDEFFLQVHGLLDPPLGQLIRHSPCALWQYNDVISINRQAKAAGVTKHMRPQQARARLVPVAGRLVHAFWRRWPGPRVNYKPYHAYTRRLFQTIGELADRQPGAVLERASSDEGYLDVTGCCGGELARAEELARGLQRHLLDRLGMRVCCGCGPNKLLAKLASTAAKRAGSGGVLAAGSAKLPVSQLLADTKAVKLPGLGGKAAQLAALRVEWISQLQSLSPEQLERGLELSAEAAAKVWRGCRGMDHSVVVAAGPPKSLVVSSWTTHTKLSDIAAKRHMGRGGSPITVGSGWLFETHQDSSKSNDTRARWILLAMALDLVDKIHNARLEWGLLPRKMTVGWQGCGTHPTPGPGLPYLNHESQSRTVPLPVPARRAFLACAPQIEQARLGESGELPADGTDVDPMRTLTHEGPELLEDPARAGCVAGLVDAAAKVLQGMVAEQPDRKVGQLSLTVTDFQSEQPEQHRIKTWLQQSVGAKPPDEPECTPLPASFDQSVWDALPDGIRAELAANLPLQQQQSSPPKALASLSPINEKKRKRVPENSSPILRFFSRK